RWATFDPVVQCPTRVVVSVSLRERNGSPSGASLPALSNRVLAMSQPESAVADAQAGDRGGATPMKGESLAAFAERHGLRRSIARPALPVYLRQLWQRRHFIVTYATSRNLSKYSNSVLGPLWQVITPLLNAAVYWLMFGLILGQKDKPGVGGNYTAFLITGVMVFTFTQRSVLG